MGFSSINTIPQKLTRIVSIFPEVSKIRIFALLMSIALNGAVYLTEIPLVDAARLNDFIFLKGAAILIQVPLGVLIFLYPQKALLNYLAGLSFFAICFISFFYRPLYTVGMFENLFIYSFAFILIDWIFILFASASFLSLILSHLLLWPHIPDAYAKMELVDYIQLDIQFLAILIFFYFFFVRTRRYRKETEKKLSLIGRNASNIAHDLKGMIMGPNLYLSRIMELVGQDKKVSAEIKELLELLTKQFGELEQMMGNFNQLCLIEKTVVTKFSAAETIQSAANVLWKKSHGSEVKIDGELIVEGERATFLSYCFNVMTNSLQAINSTGRPGKILWSIDEKKREVTCWDNGGGFSSAALAAIKAETPFSSRENGTGLGIPTIMQAAKQLNGKVSFGNRNSGALVRLTLKG